jgi:hypothetical protein
MRRSFRGPSVGQSRELIPARYNTQTVLGQEIVPDAEGRGTSYTLRLRLTRR